MYHPERDSYMGFLARKGDKSAQEVMHPAEQLLALAGLCFDSQLVQLDI
jgi:hypothetical protein